MTELFRKTRAAWIVSLALIAGLAGAAHGSPAACRATFAPTVATVLEKAQAIHASDLYLTMSEVGGDAGTFNILARARGGLANTLFKFEIPHAKEYSRTEYPANDPRAVSEARLAAVLEKRYVEMISVLTATQGLGTKRPGAFANTAMTTATGPGQAWLGLRLPVGGEILEIRLHATLAIEGKMEQQQKSLGALGLNLIHGAAKLGQVADVSAITPAFQAFLRQLRENQPSARAINVNKISVQRVTVRGQLPLIADASGLAVALIEAGAARTVLLRGGEMVDPGTLTYGKNITRQIFTTLAAAPPLAPSATDLTLLEVRLTDAAHISILNQRGYAVELRLK